MAKTPEALRFRGLRRLARSKVAPVAPLPAPAPDTSGLQVSPPYGHPDYADYVRRYEAYEAAQARHTDYNTNVAPAIGTRFKPNPQTPEGRAMDSVIERNANATIEAASGAGAVAVTGAAATAFVIGESLTFGVTLGLTGGLAAGGVLLVDAVRRKRRIRKEVKQATNLTELAEIQEADRQRKVDRKQLLKTRLVFTDVTTKEGVTEAKLFGYEPVAKITRPWFIVGRNVRVWPYRTVGGKIPRDSITGDPILHASKTHAHAEFSWGWPTPAARRRAAELAVRGTPGLRSGLPTVDRSREVGQERNKTDLVLRTRNGSRKVELIDKGGEPITRTVWLARKNNADRKLRVAAKRVRLRRSGEVTMWRWTGKGLVTPWAVYGRAA